jgi:hypothetical protein
VTAQVVLMNKFAVALASDSVVSQDQGNNNFRTLATSEKIIRLSGEHDVAIMVSGNLALRGYPFEVLVWEWSKTLMGRLPSVADYLPSFIAWLEVRPELQEDSAEEEYFVDLIDGTLQKIWNGSDDLKTIGEVSQDSSAAEAFLEFVKDWDRYAKSRRAFPGWSEEFSSKLTKNKYSDIVDSRINYWFDDRPIAATSRNLIASICETLPAWATSEFYTELVVTGFGNDELLPKMSAIGLFGILSGVARHNEIEVISIGSRPGFFRFFGQWDASMQFIRGLDSGIQETVVDFMERYVRTLVSTQSMFIEDEGDEDLELFISEKVRVARSELEDLIREQSKEKFEGPLMQVISMSPEADLARMARSLIEIQSIRQSINQITPTVGGPIDVAVISKTNSFRWVRHKSLESKFHD